MVSPFYCLVVPANRSQGLELPSALHEHCRIPATPAHNPQCVRTTFKVNNLEKIHSRRGGARCGCLGYMLWGKWENFFPHSRSLTGTWNHGFFVFRAIKCPLSQKSRLP